MLTSINWDDFNTYISQYSDEIKIDMLRYLAKELDVELSYIPQTPQQYHNSMIESNLDEDYVMCPNCGSLYSGNSHTCPID